MKPHSSEHPTNQHGFALPTLPRTLRYYDDFSDTYVSIRNLAEEDIWPLTTGGYTERLNFLHFEQSLRPLMKCWCAFQLQSLSPYTVRSRYWCLKNAPEDDLLHVVTSSPKTIGVIWKRLLSSERYDAQHMASFKSILAFLSHYQLNAWSVDHAEFLSSLPSPTVDKYASVRTGSVFLSPSEEATLVEHFDTLSRAVVDAPRAVPNQELTDTSILICSFQFGLRPLQIGRLQMRDVRIWKTDGDDIPSVHLTFKMAKQRSSSRSMPMTRKIKREWAPLFAELFSRAEVRGLKGTDRIFGVDSSRTTGAIIVNKTASLLPAKRSAMELRHTAAQRLVDAGANQEELAEFMGHADLDTGLVYFQTSANQAERVNQALGVSSVYQRVTRIAHDRFISQEELADLKGDQQIAGVPHGIPISGIGGCASGQAACQYNPVTSCYGCRKFMPLNDIDVHQAVLADFRSIVTFFSEAGRGDENSPAYLQLRRTLSSIQSIIAETQEARHE